MLTALVPMQRQRCWAMCAIWATLAKLPMCGLVEWCCLPCSSAGTPFKLGPGTHPTPANSNKHVKSFSLNAFRLEMLCKFFSLLSCISPQCSPAQFQVANRRVSCCDCHLLLIVIEQLVWLSALNVGVCYMTVVLCMYNLQKSTTLRATGALWLQERGMACSPDVADLYHSGNHIEA